MLKKYFAVNESKTKRILYIARTKEEAEDALQEIKEKNTPDTSLISHESYAYRMGIMEPKTSPSFKLEIITVDDLTVWNYLLQHTSPK